MAGPPSQQQGTLLHRKPEPGSLPTCHHTFLPPSLHSSLSEPRRHPLPCRLLCELEASGPGCLEPLLAATLTMAPFAALQPLLLPPTSANATNGGTTDGPRPPPGSVKSGDPGSGSGSGSAADGDAGLGGFEDALEALEQQQQLLVPLVRGCKRMTAELAARLVPLFLHPSLFLIRDPSGDPTGPPGDVDAGEGATADATPPAARLSSDSSKDNSGDAHPGGGAGGETTAGSAAPDVVVPEELWSRALALRAEVEGVLLPFALGGAGGTKLAIATMAHVWDQVGTCGASVQ